MAIPKARDVIRDNIDDESLVHFEKQCVAVDRLFDILEKEQDPEKAYTLAISWASSVLALARTESALLSSIFPELEADLEESSEKISALSQRKREAEDMVYQLRGPTMSVAPLSLEVDLARAKEVKAAKKRRNEIFAEVLDGLDKLRPEREPLLQSIGQIKLMLRALHTFTVNRFPMPSRKLRNPMSPASLDPRADPLAAFAERYVEGMGSRGSAEAKALREAQARTRKADARPVNRFDKLGQEIH